MSLLSIGELLDMGNPAQLSSYVQYSAIDYNADGDISGISGSAIAGRLNSSAVSSIVSSMVSGKADQSSLEDCCSSMSSVVSSIQNDVSSKMDSSASSQFAVSGDFSGYVAYSALSGSGNKITSISGSAIGNTAEIPPTAQLIIDTANMSGSSDENLNYYIGVRSDIYFPSASISGYATTSLVNYQINTSVSPKLDTSAFSSYTANVIPTVLVSQSSEATGSNILYVVTGV